MKPYYEHAGVTIYHGDCREILPSIKKGAADIAITDPPYNVGFEYRGWDDSMAPADYETFCSAWFSGLRAICCRTIVFPGHGNLGMWFRIHRPSAVGCWYKPGCAGMSIIGGEEWEPWLYWTGDKGMLGGSSVVMARTGFHASVPGHPCPKPLNLLLKLIKKASSSSVIDCFLGSGTTAIAAKRLGISCIGIEIEEKYCEIAAKRLSQEVFDFDEVAG